MANFNNLKQKLTGDDETDKVIAQQNAQQANVLPTEKQPPMMGMQDASNDALQRPAVTPEDLIGMGIPSLMGSAGRMVAEEAAPYAQQAFKPAFQGIKSLVADEAGSVPLKKGGILAGESLAKQAMNEAMEQALLHAKQPSDMISNQQALLGNTPDANNVAKTTSIAGQAISNAERLKNQTMSGARRKYLEKLSR